MLSVTLPWPPSVNHYYRHVGRRVLISRAGQEYRRTVCGLLGRPATASSASGNRKPPRSGRVALAMDAFPPDRRRRDLDNTLKAICDSVQHAGVYEDDSQIDLLTVRRRRVRKGGMVVIDVIDFPLSRCPLCGAGVDPNDWTSPHAN